MSFHEVDVIIEKNCFFISFSQLARCQSIIPTKRTIFIVVLFCFTLNIHTTTGQEMSTDNMSPESFVNSTDSSQTSEFSPGSTDPIEPTTGLTSTTTFSPTTTSTVTTIAPNACYLGGFPFGRRDCITAGKNGGVVITAFILSILSFIGVLVSKHKNSQSRNKMVFIREQHRTCSSFASFSQREKALRSAMQVSR